MTTINLAKNTCPIMKPLPKGTLMRTKLKKVAKVVIIAAALIGAGAVYNARTTKVPA